MSDAASSLPDRIEQYGHALTAGELAKLIAVSTISIYKLAKANRLPCFRVGSCVRFDPRAVADWSRKMLHSRQIGKCAPSRSVTCLRLTSETEAIRDQFP
jgi:excisionase family DNA binding protein